METCMFTTAEDLAHFDTWVHAHPYGTLWQSVEWKRYQEALGRETRIYALKEGKQILASALVVIDRTSFGLSTWDSPRGPVWGLGIRDWELGKLVETIILDAKKDHCFCLYLSPPAALQATSYKLQASSRHEQPSATRIIDLTVSGEDILKQMKPKGRYNISVAEKHGIHVGRSEDISAFMRLLKKTGQRDNFSIHSARYYEAFLKDLPGSFLLLAFSSQTPTPVPSPGGGGVPRRGGVGDTTPVAGLLGVIWGSKAYYYYGASDYEHRALMAPYALQWAAMRHCKAAGCTSYDLLGIAPPAVAEASPSAEATGDKLASRPDAPPDHPWRGVSGFKEKFGGQVVTYPPEQQVILRPMANRLLKIKRKLLG